MTDNQEHNAEIDRGYYEEDYEPFMFHPSVLDSLDWLSEYKVPEPVADLLDMMEMAVTGNKKATVYVLLADFLDKYEKEIYEYVNDWRMKK